MDNHKSGAKTRQHRYEKSVTTLQEKKTQDNYRKNIHHRKCANHKKSQTKS